MKWTTKSSMIALIAVAATALVTSSAMAQGWGGGVEGKPATVDELIPRMSSGQAYTERYSFAVDFDEGGHVGMNFTISNLGIRSGYGAAEFRLRLPDRDNYSYGERVSRSNWTTKEDTFALDIDDAQIEAEGEEAFILRYNGGDVRAELRFEKQMPMWRPGNGEIRKGDDYYRFTLIAPRSNVTGRIFVDGEWRDVQGTNSGYADHVATNVAPFDLAKRFTRFRNYQDNVFVMWREVHLTDDYGGDKVSWIVVGKDDKILYEDANINVEFGNLRRDSETRYAVPHAAQIKSKQGDASLRFLLRGEEVERNDLLESYGRVARAFASRFSEPYQYNVSGDYALEVKDGKGESLSITGSSHITVDYVNH